MESIWTQETEMEPFSALQGDINTDVLIIGGGIAGLLCARFLIDAGVSCVLVEAKRLCCGITKNTTAKITSQHGLIYHKLLDRFGKERAKSYLQANEKAIEQYRQLAQGINCAFEETSAFAYTMRNRELLEQELQALQELGASAELVQDLALPFSTAGAVCFRNQAQFQPLSFLRHITEGLPVYENTKVRELEHLTAVTEQGRITAKKIIIATHFPMLNKHGSYFLKLYQQRSYVLGLKNAAHLDGMYIDGEGDGLSFRNYKDILLLGGGGHRTGKDGSCWRGLEGVKERYYPDAEILYRWATQDCMSLDDVPYIGRYSARTPDLYVATGFCKWGMTSAMVAAELLRDLILERENSFAELFSPSRSILRPQLALNGFEAVKNLLSFKQKRCPHMGCALRWNKVERSWDCPCHGSRFTRKGELIDNPATDDL